MTFAPALTWMHLFPTDQSYHCDDCPAWFGDLLHPYSSDRDPDVQVVYGQDRQYKSEIRSTKSEINSKLKFPNPKHGHAQRFWTFGFRVSNLFRISDFGFRISESTLPPKMRSASALVAISCNGLNEQALANAGFEYVRRFAAIPNLADARWFIPLDNGAVSSSAFQIYSPTRLSARLKRAAAQMMARYGIPGWYRDQVLIAQRHQPPLEQFLKDAMPEENLRLALSAGAPEPARNRKASAALLRLDGSIAGFAKISGSPLARRLLEQEAQVLTALTNTAARHSVPKLLCSGVFDDRFVLIQSQLTGSPASPNLSDAHYQFLASLESSTIAPAASSQIVARLADRALALGDEDDWLAGYAEIIVRSLDGLMTPRTIVHGDFAPWNLRRNSSGICAFDWEYGRIDGLPLIDATHHELQVGYQLHHWTVQQAADRLEAIAAGQSRFSPNHAAALQNVYLLDILLRLAEEGYGPTDEFVAWHHQLLARRVQRDTRVEAAA